MVVKATKHGVRAHVLLNHSEGPVVAEILNPVDPVGRAVRFRPLWQRNHRRWKDSVAVSASAVLDGVIAADSEVTPGIDGREKE